MLLTMTRGRMLVGLTCAILGSGALAARSASTDPASGNAGPPLTQKQRAGKVVYDQHCAACHGDSGDGNGPAAVWLFPKPRVFSAGLFKMRSTPEGFLPTDEDLFNTITTGMAGSSMPSFAYLPEQERRDVVEYVKYLTAYVDASGKRVNRFDEALAAGRTPRSIPVPPEPAVTVQSLIQGKEAYTKLQCATCHGETGAGDGPSASQLKDNFGYPARPRDFNVGAFHGGSSGRHLYIRIATGLAGTPMPAFGEGVISDQERWSLVHYIQSLRRKDVEINDILAPSDTIIRAGKTPQELPSDPADPAWDRLDPIRVPMNPLWPTPDPLPSLAVRALHDGRQVAILVQWRDPIVNGAPVRVQDFQDAVAIQFSSNGTTPFLGMGDADNPVNIWQWKAGWQQETEGTRPDVNTVYASMQSDVYFETRALYRTAEAAGNLFALQQRRSPIEDSNARGFGTLKAQPLAGQNVNGKGIWRDEHWSVLFVRTLNSADVDDVKLSPESGVPVAFAIWQGQYRDRNGKKVISNWYQFQLEP